MHHLQQHNKQMQTDDNQVQLQGQKIQKQPPSINTQPLPQNHKTETNPDNPKTLQWLSKFKHPKKYLKTANSGLDNTASSQPTENFESKDNLQKDTISLKTKSIQDIKDEPMDLVKALNNVLPSENILKKKKKRKYNIYNPWDSIVIPLPDKAGNIPCEECSQFFTTNNRYKNHRLAKHELVNIVLPAPDENGIIQCPDCGISFCGFKKERLYRRHRWVKHDGLVISCSSCNASFPGHKALNIHIKICNKLTFPCEYCETNSKPLSNSDRKDFLNNHNIRKKLQCDICEFEACRKALRWHANTVHNHLFYEGIYNCDRCKFKHHVYENMKNHISQLHDKTRLVCDRCDFSSLRPGDLLKHKQNIHDNIKYECKHCDFSATRFRELQIHDQTKHNGSVVLVCGEYSNRKALKTRMKKCKFQTRALSAAMAEEVLSQHKNTIHKVGGKFVCDQCDSKEGFSSKNSLYDHNQIAHGTQSINDGSNKCV